MGAVLQVDLPQPIADALQSGATVVTANQRAARTLRYSFDQHNLQLGLKSWETAPILPWDAWVASLWRNLLVHGRASELLLNRFQEHKLWRDVLATDTDLAASLQSLDSLAEMAANAWQLLARHHGRERLRGSWGSPETKAFQRWAAEFERRCRMQKLLPRAALEDALRAATEEGRLLHARPIALVGFDEMTPAQQTLVSAISLSGARIDTLPITQAPLHRFIARAEDEISEIFVAARWAKNLLRTDVNTRIAVIVPNLESRRSAIDRVFREVLAPELEDIQTANHTGPYEFSLGVPLSETPLVRVALDLVRWPITALPIERVSALLVSPLFAMDEGERSARAAFDAFELRRAKLLRPEISLPWLINSFRRSRHRMRPSRLLDALEALNRSGASQTHELRSHAAWADLIRNRLQAAGWGRAEGEDSAEFQLRQKWESTLDELTALDFDGVPISFDQALRELERMAQQTLFAPASHYAPVQVMGPLEAAGNRFDAIWFLGAGDLAWPMKSATNPLLPWPLQRDLGVPGADPAVDDMRSRLVTERIGQSAPFTIFSYAAEGPEGAQRPSPLLRTLHLETIDAQTLSPPEPQRLTVELEEFSDRNPPPPLPDHAVPGGAEILKLQAACSFRAFAERRLGSAELREIDLGMDAAERGSIVHRALEHLWKQVRSHAALKAMPQNDRERLLADSIEYGLERAAAATTTRWEEAYVDLQRARLAGLLNSWLDIELNRGPFTVKLSEEEFRDVRIGPLRLNVRVDRVDVTENGEVIIDYKTGGAKAAQWQTERPDEPQLPLYAVLSTAAQPEMTLADIAFAQVRTGKDMAFESFTRKITAGKEASKRPEFSLEDQLVRWRGILENLASEFHHGLPLVDPKSYPTTCAHCAQRILCRLNPAAFDEDFDEETGIDSGNG
ncbi:PD-(D/E)XK nuclease family protein [Edaphobacter modestus]|uniref:Putative DNA repair protein n=1 Tax=Edaphobacter modestus TaxID=388466 RepID=A0A4Q7YRC3_9BACT|nr:PD-(D/E)XK nuclease family protein [Edaphobacter modestus]RZU39491.1 putative DNA repair protein [Edaphobacter modestus]